MVFAAACASTSSSQPKAITAPTAAPAPAVNPFKGARFYVDPEFGAHGRARHGADARGHRAR